MKKSKIDYYLKIASIVASQSKCKHRRFGAVIVKDDAIVATGYNGSCRGTLNCGSDISCLKDIHGDINNLTGAKGLNDKSDYSNCPAVHGEMDAIINAARTGVSVVGATMYVAEVDGKSEIPCYLCRRFIIQVGILDVYDGFPEKFVNHYYVKDSSTRDFIDLENGWMKSRL